MVVCTTQVARWRNWFKGATSANPKTLVFSFHEAEPGGVLQLIHREEHFFGRRCTCFGGKAFLGANIFAFSETVSQRERGLSNKTEPTAA